ncbi:hypothetical protein CPB84DRAFT_662579 [Gymnopilus junonius]|uniref:Uncharacterized protein n=1 Tax=Gymnopilus junonius TaxID=109634 RepID=A0A9P5N7P2_GYMJU|nr:hypothetical protein CPB84DRAFT_662579 [Gymnopilus junonius]
MFMNFDLRSRSSVELHPYTEESYLLGPVTENQCVTKIMTVNSHQCFATTDCFPLSKDIHLVF